ncbi:MAG: archease [Planctomycetes bacterium]|nr:archease [Planctomycetota bacterium]
MGTYTTFDHTADVGLDVRGRDLADVLATAARAVFDQMLEDRPDAVAVRDTVDVRIDPDLADDAGEVLVAWLQELLYRFETARLVPMEVDVEEASPDGVRARVGFGRFDPARHGTRLQVKAVTYHGLEVRQTPDGSWRARLILDV